MAKPIPEAHPSQERLIELFAYDEVSGELLWKPRPGWQWDAPHANKRAGYVDCKGYISIKIGGRKFRAHRLIWIYNNGDIEAEKVIDHLDGNPSNNILTNLRCVTPAENQKNQKIHSRNTSGYCGVFYDKTYKKWCAMVCQKSYGRFNDKESAAVAVVEARRRLGYTERHGA